MSVSKAHNWTKNKPRWQFFVRLKNNQGETIARKKEGFSSMSESEEAEREFIREYYINQMAKGSIRFITLVDHYLLTLKNDVELSSYGTIENKVVNHIVPYFDYISDVNRLNANDIMNFHIYLKNKNFVRGEEKKLSLNYIKSINSILISILNHGIVYFDLQRNVASLVKIKEKVGDRIENNKKKDYYTLNEFFKYRKGFYKETDLFEWNLIFELLFWTGIRLCELRGLIWSDINENFNMVSISRNVVKSRSKNMTAEIGVPYIIKSTKSVSSKRDIPIPTHIKIMLKSHKKLCSQFFNFSTSSFIFGIDTPVSETSIRRHNKIIADRAKIRKITIHSFRHSYGTLINGHYGNISTTSSVLGHTDASISQIYIHTSSKEKDEIRKVLDSMNK